GNSAEGHADSSTDGPAGLLTQYRLNTRRTQTKNRKRVFFWAYKHVPLSLLQVSNLFFGLPGLVEPGPKLCPGHDFLHARLGPAGFAARGRVSVKDLDVEFNPVADLQFRGRPLVRYLGQLGDLEIEPPAAGQEVGGRLAVGRRGHVELDLLA